METMITGMAASLGSRFSALSTVQPSTWGIITSSRMAEGRTFWTMVRASGPLVACSTR